jgi:hypothetical protein
MELSLQNQIAAAALQRKKNKEIEQIVDVELDPEQLKERTNKEREILLKNIEETQLLELLKNNLPSTEGLSGEELIEMRKKITLIINSTKRLEQLKNSLKKVDLVLNNLSNNPNEEPKSSILEQPKIHQPPNILKQEKIPPPNILQSPIISPPPIIPQSPIIPQQQPQILQPQILQPSGLAPPINIKISSSTSSVILVGIITVLSAFLINNFNK